MNSIRNNDSYKKEDLEIIQYGLETIYIFVTKFIIISSLAILLGVFKEYIIFLLIYNIIRTPSFGLHATKSWICSVASSIIFILVPIIAKTIIMNNIIKVLIGCYCIIRIYQNAPADTEKRPIVNPKRRLMFKYISTLIAIIMVTTSLIIKDTFLSNSFLLTLVVQTFMISPYVYKLFGLKYNNYLTYLNQNNSI